MRRSLALIFLFSTLCLSLLGCDAQNLPTQPTPVGATPTAQATQPEATPTAEPPAPTQTATEVPSPTTIVEEATATVEAPPSPTEAAVAEADTPTPRPTRTPAPAGPTRTPAPTAPGGGSGEGEPTPTDVPSNSNLIPATGPWAQVVRVAPGNHRIALTFDAGASGETWPRVMAALRERGLHITMFFTGKFAEQYPDAVKQAVADGHELGNHTYSHPDMRTLTDQQMVNELARTEGIIFNLTGASSKPYWRPPFGAYNAHVLSVAATQGYRSIYWTLDSLDSVGQPKTPDFIFNRVTNTPGVNLDGAIVLQHFGSEASVEALPRELDRLQEMGLKVCTISELISP